MADTPIDRWISLEMGNLQRGLVAAPRPLGDLLLEDEPSAPTRGGTRHAFDKGTLLRFSDALSALDKRKLKLPITFFVDHETPNDAYLQDEVAARLLIALGEVTPSSGLREGRLWIGLARAQAIAARYLTGFQFVHH